MRKKAPVIIGLILLVLFVAIPRGARVVTYRLPYASQNLELAVFDRAPKQQKLIRRHLKNNLDKLSLSRAPRKGNLVLMIPATKGGKELRIPASPKPLKRRVSLVSIAENESEVRIAAPSRRKNISRSKPIVVAALKMENKIIAQAALAQSAQMANPSPGSSLMPILFAGDADKASTVADASVSGQGGAPVAQDKGYCAGGCGSQNCGREPCKSNCPVACAPTATPTREPWTPTPTPPPDSTPGNRTDRCYGLREPIAVCATVNGVNALCCENGEQCCGRRGCCPAGAECIDPVNGNCCAVGQNVCRTGFAPGDVSCAPSGTTQCSHTYPDGTSVYNWCCPAGQECENSSPGLCVTPTATPSTTPTQTATATVSATNTSQPSATSTSSPTASATGTAPNAPTDTPAVAPTQTATVAPTSTAIPTQPAATATPWPTGTVPVSPSVVPTTIVPTIVPTSGASSSSQTSSQSSSTTSVSCGDGVCDSANENDISCCQDCGGCGSTSSMACNYNNVCETNEQPSECAADCNCGNGTCDSHTGETAGNCCMDCGGCMTSSSSSADSCNDNGSCDIGESVAGCPGDCSA